MNNFPLNREDHRSSKIANKTAPTPNNNWHFSFVNDPHFFFGGYRFQRSSEVCETLAREVSEFMTAEATLFDFRQNQDVPPLLLVRGVEGTEKRKAKKEKRRMWRARGLVCVKKGRLLKLVILSPRLSIVAMILSLRCSTRSADNTALNCSDSLHKLICFFFFFSAVDVPSHGSRTPWHSQQPR